MRIFCERVRCNICSYTGLDGKPGDILPPITYKVLTPKADDRLGLYLNSRPFDDLEVNYDLSKITVSVVPRDLRKVCEQGIDTIRNEDLSSTAYEGEIIDITRGLVGERSESLFYQCAESENAKQIQYPKSLTIFTIDAEGETEEMEIFNYEQPPIPYDYATQQ